MRYKWRRSDIMIAAAASSQHLLKKKRVADTMRQARRRINSPLCRISPDKPSAALVTQIVERIIFNGVDKIVKSRLSMPHAIYVSVAPKNFPEYARINIIIWGCRCHATQYFSSCQFSCSRRCY